MPGNQTELTARLEISKRQFFQWHFVEKCSIPEVKERMDELTQALISANYDFDFVAEESSWKSRSRYWNKLGKAAWQIERHQKGEGLLIPRELADVPVWIEWGQDVGGWRNPNSKESARTENHRGDLEASFTPLSSLPSMKNKTPYNPSDPTRDLGIAFPASSTTTETMSWPQQGSTGRFLITPLLHSSRQQPNPAYMALQDYTHGPDSYHQSYQTAAPAPDPLSKSIHGQDHDEPVPYMEEDIEVSPAYHENWSMQNPGSAAGRYTLQGGNPYWNDFA